MTLVECPIRLCPGPAREYTFVNATIRICVSEFIPINQPSASVSPYLTKKDTNLHLPPHTARPPLPSPPPSAGRAPLATQWAWRSDQNQKLLTHDQSESSSKHTRAFYIGDTRFSSMHSGFSKFLKVFRFYNHFRPSKRFSSLK